METVCSVTMQCDSFTMNNQTWSNKLVQTLGLVLEIVNIVPRANAWPSLKNVFVRLLSANLQVLLIYFYFLKLDTNQTILNKESWQTVCITFYSSRKKAE